MYWGCKLSVVRLCDSDCGITAVDDITVGIICAAVYMYWGCKLSVVRLCDSDCGITAVDDITVGITCAAFCFHIAHIVFASSWCTCFVCRLLFIIIIIIIIIILTEAGGRAV